MRRLVGAAMALVVAAAPAAARTWVVDQYGAGDLTTIQAALDSVQITPGTDTVIVRAGHYAEHLTIWQTFDHWPDDSALVVCPDGPEATTVLNVATPEGAYQNCPAYWRFRGMGFMECVVFRAGLGEPYVYWDGCAFQAGFDGNGSCTYEHLQDCDFYGPVRLMYYNARFRRLRFHHAPLTTMKWCGTLSYSDCLFEGGARRHARDRTQRGRSRVSQLHV